MMATQRMGRRGPGALWWVSGAVALMLLLLAPPVSAQEGLEAALSGLKWGNGKDQVMKYFKELKDSEFKSEAAPIRDSILKERLRREKIEQYKEIEASYQELRGTGRTGYEVSVVGGEFQKNNSEALVRAKDDRAQKFYFFYNGRLWKMAIVYNTDYLSGIGFEAFIDQVSRKYGESDESEYDAEGFLARAMWRDERTELRIEDKSEFFGTFVMVFSDVTEAQRRREAEAAFDTGKPKELRPDLAEIQEDDGFAADSNIVDRLVGSNIEVNVDRGRPEEQEIRRVGSKPVAKEDGDDEKKKKKKKVRGPRKGAAKGKKSDDLIIY